MIATIANYSFLQNAFLIGFILGLLLPIVGIIVLLRKIPFIADALGHINMSAIAFSYLLSSTISLTIFSNMIIVIIWTVLGAILIEYISHKYNHYKDVSVMVVYSIAIALTMIFLNLSVGFQSSLYNILFGNINTVTIYQILASLFLTILIIFIVALSYKKILIISIDGENSKLYNVNLISWRYLTMIIIALTITVSIKVLGVLLVSSLILLPNLAAIRLAKSLKQTILYSIIITQISFFFGIIISYLLSLSTSAVVVLIAVGIYGLSLTGHNNK